MLDNNEKWDELRNKLFIYPDNLSGVEARFENRVKREKRKKRTILSSITAFAASILFVFLININPAFANAVSDVPVIGRLAEYVKFDKSLSKAIENEYVQRLDLVSWDGNNRLLLPYAIADEKKLILFFQMPEEFEQQPNQWINIFLKSMKNSDTGEEVEGYGYSASGLSSEGRDQNFGFIMQDYHFTEGKMPRSIDLEVEVKIENTLDSEEDVISEKPYDAKSNSSFETMGTFNFHIELEDFVEPKTYEINKSYTILDQNIIAEDMKVYPTGTEVNFSFPKENYAFIKGLELEVVQDNYKILKGNINGFSSTNDVENTWMRIFIESSYFDAPKKQELLIKGVRLLNKDEEFITVDIDNKTITPNIEGLELKQVIKKSDDATLVFSTQTVNDDNFQMFNRDYKDTDGNVYRLDSEGTSSYNSQMETLITVKYPQSGKVVLQRSLAPIIFLDEPIRIKLPIND
ncbi:MULTISPECIES: DUF4179 domain-containing protein [unclassified Sedimentibacter]|uniref:DUF4179 domain-containing protein n=1 Tax=unclassified Sedimentibacter TaxID=2649220 RepID=UPI0027E1C30F|nr:DUF4179 domain-containing protein [Sedimentibacter sp. MB35-C1]WMJ77264.1 DUF4179 domain-containing protein [Sedimentibacter sp. MB35-C1]